MTWATPAGRSWWRLTTLVRHIDANDSGLWRTPHGLDNEGNPRRNGPTGNELGRPVTRSAWPTATSQDSQQSGAAAYDTSSGRHAGTTLTDAARGLWARPQARDWKGPVGICESRQGADLLPDQAKRAGLLDQGSHSGSGKSRDLWPSPNAALADGGHGTKNCSETGRKPDGTKASVDLSDMAKRKTPSRGQLNSRWVAQLMGYPSDWCDLPVEQIEMLSKRTATRSSRRLSSTSAEPS